MILIEQVLRDLTVQTIQGRGNTDKALFRTSIQSQQSNVNQRSVSSEVSEKRHGKRQVTRYTWRDR